METANHIQLLLKVCLMGQWEECVPHITKRMRSGLRETVKRSKDIIFYYGRKMFSQIAQRVAQG